VTGLASSRVAPFGHLGIIACVPLPQAYRSLPRPSSPPCAQASPTCLLSLDYNNLLIKQSVLRSFIWSCANRTRSSSDNLIQYCEIKSLSIRILKSAIYQILPLSNSVDAHHARSPRRAASQQQENRIWDWMYEASDLRKLSDERFAAAEATGTNRRHSKACLRVLTDILLAIR
jgi:hypothetical protein